ncbi:hypothetical protein GKC30_09475 [Pseudodesulfovibrio sp. F-1]|uniref:Uncharacterized protein n=1 Tax=Pseudodesulfovibrio alkaliphilus TaxID=2661613 RepID=A0A7K1KP50_9BACT|nr:hypothetical protein [Pseudodesulfovibrio alkaliphilus]MUM77863.1 hypothetical protein [Pseudodesulfovibrio alkaliphilus]
MEGIALKNAVCAPLILLILLLAAPGAAAQGGECNAIPWGEPLSAVELIEFSHVGDGVHYYRVTKVEACGLSKIEDTRVTYGFKNNRLYTTIVEIDKARDVGDVIALLMDEYGLPDHKKHGGWDIYQWDNDTLRIKLKSQYTTDRIKIGMYYKPLMDRE